MCDRTYSFSDVILSGGAADGGLYVPADDLPEITVGELQRLVHMNYCERALRILERLVHPSDVHPSLLRHCVHTAFNTGDYLTCIVHTAFNTGKQSNSASSTSCV